MMDLSRVLPQYNEPRVVGIVGVGSGANREVVKIITRITEETRNESHNIINETLGERQKLIINHLNDVFTNGATAKELSVSMFGLQLVPSPERNSVHPRLNELVEKGLVVIIGTKTCEYTNRKVAIYKNNK